MMSHETSERLATCGARGASEDRANVFTKGTFNHVLVCLDRSEAAERVLRLATHLAQQNGARMTLLHVLNARADGAETCATDALAWEIVRQEGRAYLDRVAERVAALGVEAETRMAEGWAPQGIAVLADELDADLLVLSTHGAGGGDAWPLGRTAQRIVGLTHRALLVVPTRTGDPLPQVPPARVLVPLDGSLRAECVLPTAVRLARPSQAEVVVAHVVAEPLRTEVLSTPDDLALARQLTDRLVLRADAYLERVRTRLEAAGTHASATTVRCTDHLAGLVALAAGARADLIVVAAHGSTCNPHRRFGSVTSYAIANATVPVLVVQDLASDESREGAERPRRLPPRSLDPVPGRV
jgi:nucleotide-binding universal stress UspA family protein